MSSDQFKNFIGVDVSKDKIDIFSSLDGKHLEVKNDQKSITKAFKKFDNSSSYVVLENTGGYERKCIDALIALNFTIHRTDNRKAKYFMNSLKCDAKTDMIDAKKLSKYGQERHKELPVYKKPSETQEKIRELSLYLEKIKVERAGHKNRQKSPGCEMIKSFIEETIATLNTLIKSIEKKIDDLCKEQKDHEDKIKLLCEVKGVGRVSAIKLLAHMPELGTFNRRESAALSGVAPCAKDSGKKQGYRRTIGGRQIIKKTLFMVALSAVRSGKMKAYYESLKNRGKKKMVALTACMRKIITQLNAILRDGKIIQKNA